MKKRCEIAVELGLSLPQIGVLNERLWYNVPNRLTYVLPMTAIRALKNQYLGINTHLHSLLQNEGEWEQFHSSHLVHLTTTLQAQLLPMGYKVKLEKSLQIRRVDDVPYFPESDVSIFDPDVVRVQQPRASFSSYGTQELVLELPRVFQLVDEDVAYYKAVGLYAQQAKKGDDPIVWIELLSPTNKPRGRHFDSYREKRKQVLEKGILFIEIDYLHQSPPAYAPSVIPDYTQHKQDAFAYRITMIDPHPEFVEGKVHFYQFGVDQPLPTITIPLSGTDKLVFDFGVPYKKTFEEMFFGEELDYSQLPPKFETYNFIDRQRIASRMVAIKKAVAAGLSLENEPQPIELVSLEEALQQLSV